MAIRDYLELNKIFKKYTNNPEEGRKSEQRKTNQRKTKTKKQTA